ncbi:hypothetical protein G7066_12530 [Leucobacter coleopterorum]|uniref:SLH domain-containing protein n=1 Tax=Leucobacter coleopterorum TaxID=2714933 RepID=A0ABX6K233_9MICO|nr:S-layer homology domain-containing protein [Leucobacter coleopterorum]QIM19185.1 hypothetical protein G7066_12530 [Leucobacter coleopterorum]
MRWSNLARSTITVGVSAGLVGASLAATPAFAAETLEPNGRLVVTTASSAMVLDAQTLDLVSSHPLPNNSKASASVASDGRHVFLRSRAQNKTWILDGGSWSEPHGDHDHYYAQEPKLLNSVVEGNAPGHVVSSQGRTVVYHDGTGVAASFAESDLARDSLNIQEFNAGAPHHGIAVPLNKKTLVSLWSAGTLPGGVSVFGESGETLETFEDCPELHGEGIVGQKAVFGCQDGMLVTDGVTASKIAYPNSDGQRAGVFASPEQGATTVAGSYYSAGKNPRSLVIANTAQGTAGLVDLGVEYTSFTRGPGDDIVVASADGKVRVVNDETLQEDHVFQATATSLGADGETRVAPLPGLAVAGDNAYVTNPALKELSSWNLKTGAAQKTITLDEAPVSVVAVGPASETGEEPNPDPEPVPDLEKKETSDPEPRLALAYGDRVSLWNAASLTKVADVATNGAPVLWGSTDDRHIYVNDRGSKKLRVLDAGSWREQTTDTDGHETTKYFTAQPKFLTAEVEGAAPGHVDHYGGETVAMYEAEAKVRRISKENLANGSLSSLTIDYTDKQHGAAVPLKDHTVITLADKARPGLLGNGIAIYNAKGEFVKSAENCPRAHGQGVAADIALFTCVDGIVGTNGDEIFEMEYPSAGNRAATLVSPKGDSTVISGDFYNADTRASTDSVLLMDVKNKSSRAVAVGSSYDSYGGMVRNDADDIIVVTDDGKLHVIDDQTGAKLLESPVSDSVLDANGTLAGTRHKLEVIGETAFVANPNTQKLATVDLKTGNVVKTADLDASLSGLSVANARPTAAEEHVETTLSITGAVKAYKAGDTATLAAKQNPETDEDHYHWFIKRAGAKDFTVINGELSGTLKYKVKAEDLDAQIIARLYSHDHEIIAESKPVTLTAAKEEVKKCKTPRSRSVFTDVAPGQKFYTEIDWMHCAGLTTGIKTPNGVTFAPKQELSREAMAAFMFRMEGDNKYVAPKVSPFADVTPSDKFYREIAWMAEKKLSTGTRQATGKPLFKPKDELSREAMAAFIYRMEKPKGYVAPKSAVFADMRSGAKFYTEVSWMYDAKLSTGYKQSVGKPKFEAKRSLSREAMAAFMYRLVTDYRK